MSGQDGLQGCVLYGWCSGRGQAGTDGLHAAGASAIPGFRTESGRQQGSPKGLLNHEKDPVARNSRPRDPRQGRRCTVIDAQGWDPDNFFAPGTERTGQNHGTGSRPGRPPPGFARSRSQSSQSSRPGASTRHQAASSSHCFALPRRLRMCPCHRRPC